MELPEVIRQLEERKSTIVILLRGYDERGMQWSRDAMMFNGELSGIQRALNLLGQV
jgi:hypothetical protein